METLYRYQLSSKEHGITSKILAKEFVNILFMLSDDVDHHNLQDVLVLWIENYPKIYSSYDEECYEKKKGDIGLIRQEYQLKQVDDTTWENVYFVLCKGKILMYKDKKDFSLDIPPKTILLHDSILVYSVTEDLDHPFSYSIESHGNSHLFEANDEDERVKWVDLIRNSYPMKKKKYQ